MSGFVDPRELSLSDKGAQSTTIDHEMDGQAHAGFADALEKDEHEVVGFHDDQHDTGQYAGVMDASDERITEHESESGEQSMSMSEHDLVRSVVPGYTLAQKNVAFSTANAAIPAVYQSHTQHAHLQEQQNQLRQQHMQQALQQMQHQQQHLQHLHHNPQQQAQYMQQVQQFQRLQRAQNMQAMQRQLQMASSGQTQNCEQSIHGSVSVQGHQVPQGLNHTQQQPTALFDTSASIHPPSTTGFGGQTMQFNQLPSVNGQFSGFGQIHGRQQDNSQMSYAMSSSAGSHAPHQMARKRQLQELADEDSHTEEEDAASRPSFTESQKKTRFDDDAEEQETSPGGSVGASHSLAPAIVEFSPIPNTAAIGSNTFTEVPSKQSAMDVDEKCSDLPGKPAAIVISSSDDDLQITKVVAKPFKEDTRIVCLGRLGPCFAMAFRVPNPGVRPTKLTHWPRIRVKVRDGQHDSSLFFVLSDPTGVDFAKVDLSTARVLRYAIDISKGRFPLERMEIYLKRRPMLPGEEAGDAYPAGTRCHYPIDFTFNVPKPLAAKLSDYISRFNMQLTHIGMRNMADHEDEEHDQDIELWVPRFKDVAAGSGDGDFVEQSAVNIITSYSSTDLASVKQSDLVTTPLLPHQEQALYFMTEREKNPFTTAVDDKFMIWKPERKDGKALYYNKALHEHVEHPPNPVLGGILADDMGLGKTLSMLALIASTIPQAEAFSKRKPTLLKSGLHRPNLKATLIIMPTSLIEANWQKQIDTHLAKGKCKVIIFYGPERARNVHAFADADIVLTTYGVVEADSRIPYKRGGPILPKATWFRILLDEAHTIRNQDTNRARSCCVIEANRRWAITGTPIQNSIFDLGSLCAFLRLQPFDKKLRFKQYIDAPLRAKDPIVLPRLRILVDTMTLRRTKDNLGLPDKDDGTVSIEQTQKERQLYDVLAENTFKQMKAMTHNRTKLAAGTMANFLKKLTILRQFCAHKQDMLSEDDLKLLKGFTADSPIDIEDEEEVELGTQVALDMLAILRDCARDVCDCCGVKIQLPGDSMADEDSADLAPDQAIGYMNACYHLICPKCRDKFMKEQDLSRLPHDDQRYACKICDRVANLTLVEIRWIDAQEFFRRREELRAQPRLAKQLGTYTGPSSKVLYLLSNCQNFKKWNAQNPAEKPIKAVVFSYWTTHLDLIEIALEDHDIKYVRLDGRMGQRQRLEAINQFEQDHETIIFLISIGAGGVGLNLVAANVVFIMEPQWNPQAEQQAVDRVHRIGQTRTVRVARLIASNTIEERVQQVGQRKMELSRVTLTRTLGRKADGSSTLMDFAALFGGRK